jgi:acyl-CoA thioesterase 8
MESTLALEEIDLNIYRSKYLWKPLGGRGVFGGQIIGLSLAASNKTVESNYHVHSLHSYFVLPGDSNRPLIFRVGRTRDGRSYATRTVEATQRGKIIFILMASYKIPEIKTSPLSHQYQMPNVPPPEECLSTEDRLRQWLKDPRIAVYHNLIKMRLEQPFPVEIRPISRKFLDENARMEYLTNGQPAQEDRDPIQMVWCKSKETLPDDVNLHHCVLAYLTDHELLNTALVPHGLSRIQDKTKSTNNYKLSIMASLDHSIWFHAPYRADEYMLYVMESPRTGDGRGFSHGNVFTRDGLLVLSCAQEGVLRFKSGAKEVKEEETDTDSETKSKL